MLARCMDVRTRRIATAVVGCALALATLPAVLGGSGQAGASGSPTVATAAGTASSASQLAEKVLASAPIPPGARPWTAAPPAALTHPMLSAGISGLIDVDKLYAVGEPAGLSDTDPLDSWVLAHRPAGAMIESTGSTSGPEGDATGFALSLPPAGPNDALAQLLYATTATTGGDFVLRIDAQVVWVPDRAGGEAIPPPGGAELTGFATIWGPFGSSGPVSLQLGEVDSARLADAVNALPLAAQVFCMEDDVVFTITFRPLPFTSGAIYLVAEGTCGGMVDVSVGSTQLPVLSDQGCALRNLVAGLLPARAAGTLGAIEYC
jgi:hypothetical protein